MPWHSRSSASSTPHTPCASHSGLPAAPRCALPAQASTPLLTRLPVPKDSRGPPIMSPLPRATMIHQKWQFQNFYQRPSGQHCIGLGEGKETMIPGDLSGSCNCTTCSLCLLSVFICSGFVGLRKSQCISQPQWNEILLLLGALSTGLVLVLWQSWDLGFTCSCFWSFPALCPPLWARLLPARRHD